MPQFQLHYQPTPRRGVEPEWIHLESHDDEGVLMDSLISLDVGRIMECGAGAVLRLQKAGIGVVALWVRTKVNSLPLRVHPNYTPSDGHMYEPPGGLPGDQLPSEDGKGPPGLGGWVRVPTKWHRMWEGANSEALKMAGVITLLIPNADLAANGSSSLVNMSVDLLEWVFTLASERDATWSPPPLTRKLYSAVLAIRSGEDPASLDVPTPNWRGKTDSYYFLNQAAYYIYTKTLTAGVIKPVDLIWTRQWILFPPQNNGRAAKIAPAELAVRKRMAPILRRHIHLGTLLEIVAQAHLRDTDSRFPWSPDNIPTFLA